METIFVFWKFYIDSSGYTKNTFLMIGIKEDDKKYLKFLQYPEHDLEDFKIMQINRMHFLCSRSPFLFTDTNIFHIWKYSKTKKKVS